MNRRRSPRIPRRIQVLVQPRGETQAFRSHTSNLSEQGMHIATRHARPSGTRLRIEILDEREGFVVEGVVAHARAVHPELAKVIPPGIGVRFLTPEELVAGLAMPRQAEIGSAEPPDGVFALQFGSLGQFLETYRRDIRVGGLFVPTRRPARLQTEVTVEVHPPDRRFSPIALRARVVRRFDAPLTVPTGVEPRIGMGVELLDPASALESLRPIAEQIERRMHADDFLQGAGAAGVQRG